MLRRIAYVLFFAALLPWFWLEFFGRREATEGLRHILFLVGMGCMIWFSSAEIAARSKAK